MKRLTAVLLIAASLCFLPNGMAEFIPEDVPFTMLTPDRVLFYQERTYEWVTAFGDYRLWDYNTRAAFCTIYGRIPGDYINDESPYDAYPKFPPDDCLTYEEALNIAKAFLCEYEPRITEEYLNRLHIGSYYYDFVEDGYSITGKPHVQVWIIQFVEEVSPDNYVMRCDAYLDACTGRVVSIDLGLDLTGPDDPAHHQQIDFP